MLIHITMLCVVIGMLYSCWVALGYVLLIHQNLTISSLSLVQAKLRDSPSFVNNTILGKRELSLWVTRIVPIVAAATINALVMWWMFANDVEVNTIYIVCSSLLFSAILTKVFNLGFIKTWVLGWDVQLSVARDEIILESTLSRITEISETIKRVAAGEDTLSVTEVTNLVSETAELYRLSDEIIRRQEATLTALKEQTKQP